MIGQILFLIVLSEIGSRDVFAANQEDVTSDVRERQMEFAGAAKPFTDKFLHEINSNSAAFKQLFEFANYQSELGDNEDEHEIALDHCKLTHRSEATELMLEVGLIFQEKCLIDVKVLSPEIDKTVTDFLAELKESSEEAHTEAMDCSTKQEKGPEILLECLRTVVDGHFLPLHSYLDTLAVLYVKMVDVLKNIETCEREVIDMIEKKIENLIDKKVGISCVNRRDTIGSALDFMSEGELSVENAIDYYLETLSSIREGVKSQMDVAFTRRPLRTMIKVIGKFLENEAAKMSDEINKRIEAIANLEEKFHDCVLDTPAEMQSFLDDSLTKLSYCGVSVSQLQYEFDAGLLSLSQTAVGLFSSYHKEAIEESCVNNKETDLEKVKCIKQVLLNQISETIVPLERSVADFLYEQFLKYTNMEAHLTVKSCISEIKNKMHVATVEAMKGIQACVTGGSKNQEEDRDEL